MIIGIIPDTHHPYCNMKKMHKGINELNKHKPDAWFQIGDLMDQLSFSNYPKDLSKCMVPQQEMAQARRDA